jgi:hypothetical protein
MLGDRGTNLRAIPGFDADRVAIISRQGFAAVPANTRPMLNPNI